MLVDEQLTDYNLEVTATRRDEIEGRAIVNACCSDVQHRLVAVTSGPAVTVHTA